VVSRAIRWLKFIVGSTGPEIVTSEGTVTAVAVPSDLIDDGSSPSALLVLPDGVLAGISQTGLVEFPSNEISSSDATTAAVDVSLPTPANLSSCGSPSELVVSSTGGGYAGPMPAVERSSRLRWTDRETSGSWFQAVVPIRLEY